MDLFNIILRPYESEKTFQMKMGDIKKYSFIVNPKATKKMIAEAFYSIYEIYPSKINISIRKPTDIRLGTRFPGRSKLTKIAIISLEKGVDIKFDEDEDSKDKNESDKKDLNKEIKSTKDKKTDK